MPELVTKYPSLALDELKAAGVACGKGDKPQILHTCPQDQFCKLPTGEFCIYGIEQVPAMTQIHALDLFLFPSIAMALGSLMIMIFLLGVILGLKIRKNN